jgi:hypothetical protein
MKRVDVLLGVVAPIVCLAFDMIVFKGNAAGVGPNDVSLGDARVFTYLVVGLCVALFVCQKWVKSLAPCAWLWAPCFAVVGTGALLIAIPVIPLASLFALLAAGALINSLPHLVSHPAWEELLTTGNNLFTIAAGLVAWAPAVLYLRTGLRGVRASIWSVRRVLAALAFGLAVFGVPALVNGAALDFINKRVDVILKGTREEAIASAYSLRAAFWCDASCLHRLKYAYFDYFGQGPLPDARRATIADCFRIATGYDIERFRPQLSGLPDRPSFTPYAATLSADPVFGHRAGWSTRGSNKSAPPVGRTAARWDTLTWGNNEIANTDRLVRRPHVVRRSADRVRHQPGVGPLSRAGADAAHLGHVQAGAKGGSR